MAVSTGAFLATLIPAAVVLAYNFMGHKDSPETNQIDTNFTDIDGNATSNRLLRSSEEFVEFFNGPVLASCCNIKVSSDNQFVYHCASGSEAPKGKKFSKTSVWTVPGHLMLSKDNMKFKFEKNVPHCKVGNFTGRLSLNASNVPTFGHDHFTHDGYLKLKQEYYRPDEYCVNGVKDKQLEIIVCKPNCEDADTPCIHKCCGMNEIYSLGRGGTKGGCIPVDDTYKAASENTWNPILYHNMSTKLMEYQVEDLRPHIIQTNPTSFKSKCTEKKHMVYPYGEKVAEFLSNILRRPFPALKYRLRKDGWLLNPNKTDDIAISENSRTINYCVDGVKNYGESEPFSNQESSSVLFLCAGSQEEKPVEPTTENSMRIVTSMKKSVTTATSTSKPTSKTTTKTTTTKKPTSPTTKITTTTTPTTTTTTTKPTTTTTTTTTTKPTTKIPTTPKPTTTTTTTTTTPKPTTTTTTTTTPAPTTSTTTTTTSAPTTTTTTTTTTEPTTTTTEPATTTQPTTTEQATTISTSRGTSTSSIPASLLSTFPALRIPILPTCCEINPLADEEDEISHYCRSNGPSDVKNATRTHLWMAAPSFMLSNKISMFRLQTTSLGCRNQWTKAFIQNFNKPGINGIGKNPVFMPDGGLKYKNEYFSPKEYCINGIYSSLVEVLLCKTDCTSSDTPCIQKCCGPNQIYSLGGGKTRRGCVSIESSDEKWKPILYHDMSNKVTDDELAQMRPHVIQKFPPKFQYNCFKNITLVFPFSKEVVPLMSPLAQINLEFRLRKDGKIMYKHPNLKNPHGELIESVFDTSEYCVDGIRNYGNNEIPFSNRDNQTILFVCALKPSLKT